VGVRHRCLSCPDWDYCWSCIKDAGKAHPGHRFAPLYGAIANPLAHHETHYGIICDGPLCQKRLTSTYVTGVRYKCAVCHDTDFCAACEACPTNEHNRTHPLIKFQTPVRSVQVSTLGDDGFGGPVMSMGDRLDSSTWHLNELSSARSTVVEKQTVKEEPTEDQSATEVATVSEAKDVDEQSEAPATEVGMEEKPDNATPSEPTPEYQAFFMRDTIADGTVLSPQEVFQQTWTLYNPGPSSWPVGSSVRFVGGDTMFNVDTQHPSSANSLVSAMASNELTAPVAPGESADFCVTLKSSQREGTSISYWRLKLSDGTPFGHKLWCDVTVRAGADTLTKDLREVEAEPVLSRSNMIFPKLEKESPVSSTHEAMTQTPAAPSAPSLANADEQDVLEDVESLALEDVETDTDGFLTDEEYDILDASDQEFSTDKHD
jgi:next-to-BRCA1 protein 1